MQRTFPHSCRTQIAASAKILTTPGSSIFYSRSNLRTARIWKSFMQKASTEAKGKAVHILNIIVCRFVNVTLRLSLKFLLSSLNVNSHWGYEN